MNSHSTLRLHSYDDLSKPKGQMTKQAIKKLEVFSGGTLIDELPLDKAALSIGRDPQGDVQLTDPKISRLHAKLTKISSNYFIEDCDSTNGTLLNGRPVHKHIFRPGDNLQIGNYELRYVVAEEATKPADVTHVVVEPAAKRGGDKLQKVLLFFLQGPESGEVRELKNPLHTIGRPGGSVAVVARRTQGTYLLHIGGEMPEINGVEMTEQTVQLQHGDIIDVGEHQIKITLH